MVLIGTAILPHASLVYDGDVRSSNKACRARHDSLDEKLQEKLEKAYEGMCRAGDTIASWEPDLVILHTSHGMALTDSFGVYISEEVEGGAMWLDCWDEKEFRVKASLDHINAKKLVSHFKKGGIPAEGIMAHDGVTGVDTLRWGESIPIWFILRNIKKKPLFMVITEPINNEQTRTLNAGKSLATFVSQCLKDVKVAVVTTGDMAHGYETDCTNELYLLPSFYADEDLGANPYLANRYERAAIGWAKAIDNFSLMDTEVTLDDQQSTADQTWEGARALPWLQKLFEIQQLTYTCSTMGLHLLHSVMEHAETEEEGRSIRPTIEVCVAPTYFGMMAAVFQIY